MIDRVLVYQLYELGALDQRSAALAQHLAAPGPGQPLEPSFAAMPGGCFRWKDDGRLGRNESVELLPKSAEEARRAALAYMRAVNEAAARHRAARGLGVEQHPDPFPVANLRAGDARRVRSRATGRADHWLTNWMVWMPSTQRGEHGLAPVMGAVIELRIGARGRAVSAISRARPWRQVLVRPAWPWAEEHDHGHGPEQEPPIVYIADHPEEPQRFWAPCWAIPPEDEESHHATRLWPACEHAVLPEILVEMQHGEASVFATVLAPRRQQLVIEHGREWRIRWSVATIAEFAAGERRVYEGTRAPLPGPGVYQVELEVEHVATRAVRSTHRQIAVPREPSSERA